MNEIIAGYRSGDRINKDPHKNLAYLTSGTYITKHYIDKIVIINSVSTVETIIGGATSAELLVDIYWHNGQKSVAKVKQDIFDLMIIGINSDYTESEINTISQKKDIYKEREDTMEAWKYLIGALWFVFFFFYVGFSS